MNKLLKSSNKAFTLIEILVVVSIMGILLAITLPSLGKFNESNIAAQTIQNIKSDIESTKFKALSGVVSQNAGTTILSDWGLYLDCPIRSYTLQPYATNTAESDFSVVGSSNYRVTRVLPSGFSFSGNLCAKSFRYKRISGKFITNVSSLPATLIITSTSGVSYQLNIDSDGSVTYTTN